MESTPERHRERLTAPPLWWAAVLFVAISAGWLLLVALTPVAAAVATTVVFLALGALLWHYGSVRITAERGRFRVGEAALDAPHLGTVESLDPAQWRAALDRAGADRAFLMTRPWIDRGVRVTVDDSADPTPYWLVSSRRPDSLARVVGHTGDPEGRSHDGQETREDDPT